MKFAAQSTPTASPSGPTLRAILSVPVSEATAHVEHASSRAVIGSAPPQLLAVPESPSIRTWRKRANLSNSTVFHAATTMAFSFLIGLSYREVPNYASLRAPC